MRRALATIPTLALLFVFVLLPYSSSGATDFECGAGNITINECNVNNELLEVRYTADSPTSYRQILYTFTTSEDLKFNYGYQQSTGLSDVYGQLETEGVSDVSFRTLGPDDYILYLESDHQVTRVSISDPECDGEVYLGDTAECTFKDFVRTDSVCANQPSIEARTRCRLFNSEPPSMDPPEECRVMTGASQSSCLAHHAQLLKCVQENATQALTCARDLLDVEADVQAQRIACDAMESAERDACAADLREKVTRLTRFRFELLKEKAEGLLWRGAEEDVVVNFIANLEVRNQAFNNVPTPAEKINILRSVDTLWEDFLFTVKPQVLSYDSGAAS